MAVEERANVAKMPTEANNCYDWITWLEKRGKYGKNKSIETVKPKFKVGDRVVNRFGDIWRIDSFDSKNYQVSNGGKYCYFPIKKQDEMYLWRNEYERRS